jgi:neopullulanase
MNLRGIPLTLAAMLMLHVVRIFAAAPEVARVEPPNWWVGHSVNPVRLLISGTNLIGASLEVPAGVSATAVKTSTNGSFLFADLRIPTDAATGTVPLRVVTAQGSARIEFSLFAPLPAVNRFTGFSPDDVIYLLMPDRFSNGIKSNDDPAFSGGLFDRSKPRHYHGGDFQGVINHLPYLKELGVTALWLTPWYDNVNHFNMREKYGSDNQRSEKGQPVTDYHGYGAVDFYGVEEHFGDLSKLQEMVDAAHAGGFKMIQDQVANHTGPYHPWVTNSPTATWFNGTAANHLANSWQTWTIAERNPPADKLKSTLDGWFIDILPDLNQNDPETATYLIQNSLWWVGMTGVDAVRQDTLPYVPRSYWSKWTGALKHQYPHLTILGEMFDANPKLVAFFQGGRQQFDGVDTGVDTLFDFPLYYALRDVFAKGQPMAKLSQSLAADTNYVNPRTLVTFLGLHDTPRFMSEAGATIEGLQLAFTYLLTARGTPMIYYGDEIAMNGGGDPYNRSDFPGGWAEDPRNAFEPAGRQPEEARVHDHVRKLLALRRELSPLRNGETTQLNSLGQTCAFARVTSDSSVVVAFNNENHPRTLQLVLPPRLAAQSRWFNRLAEDVAIPAADGVLTLQLPPRSAALLTPEPSAMASDQGKTKGQSTVR